MGSMDENRVSKQWINDFCIYFQKILNFRSKTRKVGKDQQVGDGGFQLGLCLLLE